jgi:hypothetical protein
MESFIKIIPQKKQEPLTLHSKEMQLLEKYISEGKNIFVCGPTGRGKSFVVTEVLRNKNVIELQVDTLHKIKLTFQDILRSKPIVLLDGYDTSVHWQKQIIDYVADNDSNVTSSLIVTSTSVHVLPNFELIIIPRRTPDEIVSLLPDNPRSRLAAEKCDGNIFNFYDYVNNSDEKDVFKTSRDVITDILCTVGTFDISQTLHEHGHVCDVIHGNYLDSVGQSTVDIIESLSCADIYDTKIYKTGEWDLMPYYALHAAAIPKMHLGEPIPANNIKAGSSWTKYGNYKMRLNKLNCIQSRNTSRISFDELSVIRQYVSKGNFEHALHYKLTPNDIDVMNHLALKNKHKPNEVMKLKKNMRSLINEF